MNSDTHIHLSGIAGVGMRGLAYALLHAGYRVSGSDRSFDQGGQAHLGQIMRDRGIRTGPQDGSMITEKLSALVMTSAVEGTNPEVLRAGELHIPILHRAEMLKRLTGDARLIAVAGTAGKTTITAMIGVILSACGRDPTVLNGGPVVEWESHINPGNYRPGRPDVWVIEVDESDRSLLRFYPDYAVISNLARDHFRLDDVRAIFQQFARQVRSVIVAGASVYDDIKLAAECEVLRAPEPDREEPSCSFNYKHCEFHIPLPGLHNVRNALAAVMICERLGCPLDEMRRALAGFQGVRRRLECVSGKRGPRVYDDYAHNPLKMENAIRAVQHIRPGRLHCIWRPHGYSPLHLMFDDLVSTLNRILRSQDRFWLLPVYYAGGSVDATVNSHDLLHALREVGVDAQSAADYDELESRVLREVAPDDTILVMGARDPELPACARRLAAAPPRQGVHSQSAESARDRA